jgi:alpha-beta hydrolase superfamily lysophospholipase
MKKEREGIKVSRRNFIYLGAAGAAGLALAGTPRMGDGAEKAADPGEVITMFPGNYTWSAATRGVMATCLFGGGDMGEIYKVCAALRGKVGDGAAWFYEWNRMAGKVARLGDQAGEKGYVQTAAGAYLRAGNYIQTGERLKQPRTPETQLAYARSVELFKKGTANHPFLSIEPVEVPFENGKSLPAYFVRRQGAGAVKWPTVVFFDGLDITKEIQYFRGVPELVKRGIACLIVDGPGNGESIRFRGMYARPDTNVAGSAAADYLEKRNDVDRDRLAVMGISLGGYYAPRIAAFEKRYKACVAWGAIYDMNALWKRRLERAQGTASSVPIEHFTWFFNVASLEEVLKKTEPFTMKEVARNIECPFLITHGEADAQVPLEEAHKLFAAAGSKDKTLKIFTREEGGSEHCQGDNLTLGITYIGDWLSEKLKAR